MGAENTLHIGQDSIPPEAFDVVFECSGVPRALSSALVSVRKAGVVIQVGMLAAGDQPIAIAPLVSKEIQLRGTFRFHTEIDSAIDLVANNPWIERAITHTYSLEEAKSAFEMAKNSEISGKVLIELL
jgi:L-idonate 5-dehydrogenase